jgi:large subunit ribosomal protein L25
LMHVDLHEVRLDRPIQTQVAIEAVGTAEGVTQGGILQLLVHHANVEALPMEIPDRLEVDVTALNIGDSAQMAALQVPERVTLLDDPETVIVAVLAPRALELPEDLVEEGEEVEEEEGEAAAAEEGAEPAPAEPEAEES